jgi:hypothetical protein
MRDPKQAVGRRGMLAGAGAVGALAAAAVVLPKGAQPEAQPVADARPVSDTAAGYRLTEHVKRYYQTAKI